MTNTYAAPCTGSEPTAAARAPTTTVAPLMATEEPKLSPAAPSEAVSLASKVEVVAHPVPGLTNTYAAPCAESDPTSAYGAPATTVSPLMAKVELYTTPPSAPSEAVSLASKV